jgi:thiosulfate/3-mercaptopyruvate sulfurtransferase
LRSGHIPGSVSLPFASVLRQEAGKRWYAFGDEQQLQRAFQDAGIDPSGPVINTCGSGVTASVNSLALLLLGNSNNSVYDGSWSEYGQEKHPEWPVEK